MNLWYFVHDRPRSLVDMVVAPQTEGHGTQKLFYSSPQIVVALVVAITRTKYTRKCDIT